MNTRPLSTTVNKAWGSSFSEKREEKLMSPAFTPVKIAQSQPPPSTFTKPISTTTPTSNSRFGITKPVFPPRAPLFGNLTGEVKHSSKAPIGEEKDGKSTDLGSPFGPRFSPTPRKRGGMEESRSHALPYQRVKLEHQFSEQHNFSIVPVASLPVASQAKKENTARDFVSSPFYEPISPTSMVPSQRKEMTSTVEEDQYLADALLPEDQIDVDLYDEKEALTEYAPRTERERSDYTARDEIKQFDFVRGAEQAHNITAALADEDHARPLPVLQAPRYVAQEEHRHVAIADAHQACLDDAVQDQRGGILKKCACNCHESVKRTEREALALKLFEYALEVLQNTDGPECRH